MHARPASQPLPRSAQRARQAAARLLLVLALALVLAQALGLMHRVTHFGPASSGPAQATQASGAESNWVASLFAGHASDSDCRLYDPLNHEGAPGVPLLVLPLLLSSFFLASCQGDFVARWAALFDARGPPLPR
ncbi:MAG TPA: hypothetical protein VIL30_14085 [Ramlibacter sp.]|jgi:hypothetical protein